MIYDYSPFHRYHHRYSHRNHWHQFAIGQESSQLLDRREVFEERTTHGGQTLPPMVTQGVTPWIVKYPRDDDPNEFSRWNMMKSKPEPDENSKNTLKILQVCFVKASTSYPLGNDNDDQSSQKRTAMRLVYWALSPSSETWISGSVGSCSARYDVAWGHGQVVFDDWTLQNLVIESMLILEVSTNFGILGDIWCGYIWVNTLEYSNMTK